MAGRVRFGLRGVAVLTAIALAVFATVALSSYVQGVKQEAEAEFEPVEAFVAAGTIPAGMRAEQAVAQGLIGRERIPKKNVVGGAISSLDQLQGKVATVDILTGEQLLAARFVEPNEVRGLAPIPEDKQAISVEVSVPPGMAQFVQNGDRVSLIAQLEVPGNDGAPDPNTPEGQAPEDRTETRTKYLLQNVEVLAVGQRVVTTTEEGEDGANNDVQRDEARVLMTVALTPAEAEKLAFAIFNGDLYFTLLPEGQEPVETQGQTAETIFDE